MANTSTEKGVPGEITGAEDAEKIECDVGDKEINHMNIHLHWLQRVPLSWKHAESGEAPDYPDNMFCWEIELQLRSKEGAEVILSRMFQNGHLKELDDSTTNTLKAEGVGVSNGPCQDEDYPSIPHVVSTKTGVEEGGECTFVKPELGVVWSDTRHHCISLTQKEMDVLIASMEEGLPVLTYSLRRTLNQTLASPDWEDVNEPHYRAHGSIPLEPFKEPGINTHVYHLSLVPLPVQEERVEDKKGKKAQPKKPAKGAPQVPIFLSTEDPDLTSDQASGHPYHTHSTVFRCVVSFDKPLVCLPGNRVRPDLRPSDIIPSRLKHTRVATDAAKLFTSEVKEVITAIVSEYRRFSREQQPNRVPPPSEESRKAFLHYLSTSGLSFAHRQKLKHCIIRIVKEKFAKRPGSSRDEMEQFYNELYVYLMDQVHITLNSVVSRNELSPPQTRNEEVSKDRWRRLIAETEAMGENELAERYHQERLVHGPIEAGGADAQNVPDVWADYAHFCLRTRDTAKAEQAFREAIAASMSHVPSLLGYGLLLLSHRRLKEAEVYLQAAVDVDLESHLAWGCLGLFFAIAAEDLEEGEEIRKEHTKWKKYAVSQAERVKQDITIDMPKALARYTLDLHLEPLTVHCLSQLDATDPEVKLLEGRVHYQVQDYDKALSALNGLPSTEACLLLGSVLAEKPEQELEKAEEAFTRALRQDEAAVSGEALVKLGNIYNALGKFQEGADSFVLAAKKWPCGVAWLGLGISLFRLGNYTQAEQALNESNVLNNLNPITWAYISLSCLCQSPGREEEADLCVQQAHSLGLQSPPLLNEIAAGHLRLGLYQKAESVLQRSLSLKESPTTHFLLAMAYLNSQRLVEARREFTSVKEHKEAGESERREATKMLADLEKVPSQEMR